MIKPADIVLVHSKGLFPRLIHLGERLHRKGAESTWTHVAVLEAPTENDWSTIEAEARGVVRRSLSNHSIYKVIDVGLSDDERAKAVQFAQSCLGVEYGYITIASMVLDLITPRFVTVRSSKTLICSELAVRTLEHGGFISPELDTSRVMPSDLAVWFDKAEL